MRRSIWLLCLLFISMTAFSDEPKKDEPKKEEKTVEVPATTSASPEIHELVTGKENQEMNVPTESYYRLCLHPNPSDWEIFIQDPANSCYPDGGGNIPQACFAQMSFDGTKPIARQCPADYVEYAAFGTKLDDPASKGSLVFYNADVQTDIPDERAVQYFKDNKYECGTSDKYPEYLTIRQAIRSDWPEILGGQDSSGGPKYALQEGWDGGRNCYSIGLNCFPKRPMSYTFTPYTFESPQVGVHRAKLVTAGTSQANGASWISAQGKLIEVRKIDEALECLAPKEGALANIFCDYNLARGKLGVTVPPGTYWRTTFTFSGPQIVCTRGAGYFRPMEGAAGEYRAPSLGVTSYVNTIKICLKKLKGHDIYSGTGVYQRESRTEKDYQCAENSKPAKP